MTQKDKTLPFLGGLVETTVLETEVDCLIPIPLL